MQSGTLAALGYPLRKQRTVTASRDLTVDDLNGTILVDTAAAAAPVVLTIPAELETLGAGAFFWIINVSVTTTFPVGIVFAGNNIYNQGISTPLSLDTPGMGATIAKRDTVPLGGDPPAFRGVWNATIAPSASALLESAPFRIAPPFADAGFYVLGGASTLPVVALTPGPIHVVNPTAGPIVVSPAVGDTLIDAVGTAGPIAVPPGGKMTFKNDGITVWQEF